MAAAVNRIGGISYLESARFETVSWADAILTLPGIYNVTGQHCHLAIIAGAKRKLFTHLKKTKAHSLKTRELETVAYLAKSFVPNMVFESDDYNILYRNQGYCLANEG